MCRRICDNEADAQDACQEALILITRKLASFDGRSAFSTWAYRVAANASMDELRRRRRRPEPRSLDHGRDSADGQASWGEAGWSPADESAGRAFDEALLRLDLDAALATLKPEYRAAVVLRDVAGLSYEEIADVLAINGGTVRSRIARGRQGLISFMTQDGNFGTHDGNFGSHPGRRT